MPSSQSPQVKTCVTCQYWEGTRKPSKPFRDHVEYASNQEKGECGLHREQQRYASSGCGKWEKWGVLK
jgi:hypothetical protein